VIDSQLFCTIVDNNSIYGLTRVNHKGGNAMKKNFSIFLMVLLLSMGIGISATDNGFSNGAIGGLVDQPLLLEHASHGRATLSSL
jgi:hypothetical protein